VTTGNHKISGGRAAMSGLLELPERPTAVLASNDLTAIGALQAVRNYGLHVPEDISLIGFDDIALAASTDPPLTTVNVSRVRVAEAAFNSLFELIDGEPEIGREVLVETKLVIRESTAPPGAERP
jgi:DNA-binding LacI/PurR family transcriptional regulator